MSIQSPPAPGRLDLDQLKEAVRSFNANGQLGRDPLAALYAERRQAWSLFSIGLRDEEIFLTFKKNWNRDNFGPVRVPEGCWFVLGDNRGNSRDSRHLGLIEQRRFVGTVVWK